ncbi:MAG: hypothetical protein JSU91_03865 [Thermoplasmatales archaeon]|nr:MAG: hypothetical protein JSU91_03865 [Thermoplasmatales archaeon]
MEKKVLIVGLIIFIFCINLSGCIEDEIIDEVMKSGNPEYIVVSVDANVRINGHPDLWDPVPGVQVELFIQKAGGEYHQETRMTGENGETGIVHTSFNLYREQPITFTATVYANSTISRTETLTWDTVEKGTNEIGYYSWSPLIILVVDF